MLYILGRGESSLFPFITYIHYVIHNNCYCSIYSSSCTFSWRFFFVSSWKKIQFCETVWQFKNIITKQNETQSSRILVFILLTTEQGHFFFLEQSLGRDETKYASFSSPSSSSSYCLYFLLFILIWLSLAPCAGFVPEHVRHSKHKVWGLMDGRTNQLLLVSGLRVENREMD